MSETAHHPISVSVPDTAAAGEAPDPALIADLVVANHILFDKGVVDGSAM